MLKKAISFSIILLLLFLGYQIIFNYLKIEHEVKYVIDNNGKYEINENYVKSDKKEYYLLKVKTEEDKEYVFETDNKYNKQKEIVGDIISYKDDDIQCVALVYRGKKDYSEPLCYIGDKLYVYSEIKNQYDLSSFIKQIPNYQEKKYSKESEKGEYNATTYNKDYLDDNEVLIIYDYKNVDFIRYNIAKSTNFSNYDNYKNILGIVVGKYYFIPRFTSAATFNTFIKYNIEDDQKTVMTSIYNISKQSYINGIYENEVYIFDKSSLTQYKVNVGSETIEIVGDESKPGFAYINGEEKEVSVYDMNNDIINFSESKDPYENIGYDEIFVQENYAIYTKDGAFYKVYEKYPEISIKLFESTGTEVKIVNNNIYFLKADSIYKYNKYGVLLLATRNELKYNPENSFDIYFE